MSNTQSSASAPNQNYGAPKVLTTVAAVMTAIEATKGGLGALWVVASRELIDWLISKDTHNRNRVPTNVARLTTDIKEGNWFATNQGIGLTKSGLVVDGGHRIAAIREAGYPPVVFMLVWGLDDRAQMYVDRHSKRHMSDIMSLLHDTAVSKRYISYLVVMIKARTGWANIITQDPVVVSSEWEAKHWAITTFSDIPKIAALPAPVFAAIADKYHAAQDDRIIDFTIKVAVGELLTAGDPAFALRNWLTNGTARRGTGGGRVTPQKERYLKTMWALDAHLDGRRVTKLVQASH